MVTSRFHTGGLRKELDLRQELSDTLFGNAREVPKGYTVYVRYMRLDANRQQIACHCNRQAEGSVNPLCPLCLGEGYLWDEKEATSFKVESGTRPVQFYFEHTANITIIDRIVELKTIDLGNGQTSIERGRVWKLVDLEYRRADNGRVEFILAYCQPKFPIYYNLQRP